MIYDEKLRKCPMESVGNFQKIIKMKSKAMDFKAQKLLHDILTVSSSKVRSNLDTVSSVVKSKRETDFS